MQEPMQIYSEMNIGTAKPTSEEMSEVPHKMINICSCKDSFSVYEFKKMAEKEIESACLLNKTPILVGGTGLYFDALFFNTDFGEMEIDEAVRSNLQEKAKSGGIASLLLELQKIDPKSAEGLCENDSKRILRALEVYLSTGKTQTEFKEKSHDQKAKFDFLKLFLNFSDRDTLYERINQRVDQMIKDGLLEETKMLMDSGTFDSKTSAQAIGYKELIPYFKGEKELSACIDLLKQKTRNYAKRQLTWFRRYTDAHQIMMDTDPSPYKTALNLSKSFLKDV
jgi:tRNA dimethylallyltransferase